MACELIGNKISNLLRERLSAKANTYTKLRTPIDINKSLEVFNSSVHPRVAGVQGESVRISEILDIVCPRKGVNGCSITMMRKDTYLGES